MTPADRAARIAVTERDILRRNREAAPEFAQFVDAMRAKFGDCRVRYVRWPDGREQGKRLEDRRD